MTERERAVPVVAQRLEPGDVILTGTGKLVHVDRGAATERHRLTRVRFERDKNHVLLTDDTGEAWHAWPTDVAWLILPKTDS